jgi:hypothetical protein
MNHKLVQLTMMEMGMELMKSQSTKDLDIYHGTRHYGDCLALKYMGIPCYGKAVCPSSRP